MSFTKFLSQRLRNLAKYRIHSLDIKDDIVFNHNGKDYIEGYILPKEHEELNLIKPFNKKSFLEDLKEEYTINKESHYLNSSQMLVFNYFMPFIKQDVFEVNIKELSSIFSKMLDEKIIIENLEFQRESELEKKDLNHILFKCKESKTVSIASIYTEDGFRGCEKKLIHLDNKNQRLIFLFPKDNTRANKEMELIKDTIVGKGVWDRITILYWEDLVEETLLMFKENHSLFKYYGEFKRKYFKFIRSPF